MEWILKSPDLSTSRMRPGNLRVKDALKSALLGKEVGKLYIIKYVRDEFFAISRYIRSLNDGEDFCAKSLILSNNKKTARQT